jgi:hypothetical protein
VDCKAVPASQLAFHQALARLAFPVPCVHLQDKCSLIQLQDTLAEGKASIRFKECVGHRGMMKLMGTPAQGIKAVKCTNCSGCKECKQPVPLTIPEGIGGTGCTAEVAAKAEALCQLAAGAKHQTGSGGAGGSTSGQATGAGTAASETPTPSNPALVECAVCRHKPGDPGVPATLKLCGGCQRIRYCSAECQRKDWKLGHKAVCQQWARGNKPASDAPS